MANIWVCNASPLILLYKVGKLDLLLIQLRGTVGLILQAKMEGVIPEAAPIIQALINADLRFEPNWVNEALALVGETIPIIKH